MSSEQQILEQQFKYASFMDDVDTVRSPKNDVIVLVAMRQGAHVCWQCGEVFGSPYDPKRGPCEKVIGTTPVLVHNACVFYQPKVFVDMKIMARAMAKAEALGAKVLERAGRRIGILPSR